MKKMTMVGLVAMCAMVSFGFRVTKDYGDGFKTYEDSRGRRGFSVDGNSWVVSGGNNVIYGGSSTNIDYDKEAFIKEVAESGKLFCISDGMGKNINGASVNLKEVKPSGTMSINWTKAKKYVVLTAQAWNVINPIYKKAKDDMLSSRKWSERYIWIYRSTSSMYIKPVSFVKHHEYSSGLEVGATKIKNWKGLYVLDIEDYYSLTKHGLDKDIHIKFAPTK